MLAWLSMVYLPHFEQVVRCATTNVLTLDWYQAVTAIV